MIPFYWEIFQVLIYLAVVLIRKLFPVWYLCILNFIYMTPKGVNKKFFEFIKEFYYNQLGYKAEASLNRFTQNNYYVSFSISKYPGSISVRPEFIIENQEIKKILIEVFSTKQASLTYLRVQSMEFAFEFGIFDDKITYSLYNSVLPNDTNPNILSTGNYRYMIEEDTDLAPILEDHKYFMEKVTFPLFDKMSTLEGIDSFLNDRILEGDMDYFVSENRQLILKRLNQKREILSGIIAAKLINNPNFENLLKRIRTMWEGNNYILDDVDKLMLYFDNK